MEFAAVFLSVIYIYRVGQKCGPQTRGHNSVKSEPIVKKITGRFIGKFLVKWILKIPPHLTYVATLPCETLTSAKQDINDKLQLCVMISV